MRNYNQGKIYKIVCNCYRFNLLRFNARAYYIEENKLIIEEIVEFFESAMPNKEHHKQVKI